MARVPGSGTWTAQFATISVLSSMDVGDKSTRAEKVFVSLKKLEDYRADFLVMLETWEAAVAYFDRLPGSNQKIEVAGLLGWTRRMSAISRITSASPPATDIPESAHHLRF